MRRLVFALVGIMFVPPTVVSAQFVFQPRQVIHVDAPAPHSSVGHNFEIAGFAYDYRDPNNLQGVDWIDLWGYRVGPLRLGEAPVLYFGRLYTNTVRWPYPTAGFRAVAQVPRLIGQTFNFVFFVHSKVSGTYDNAAYIPNVTIRDCHVPNTQELVFVPPVTPQWIQSIECR